MLSSTAAVFTAHHAPSVLPAPGSRSGYAAEPARLRAAATRQWLLPKHAINADADDFRVGDFIVRALPGSDPAPLLPWA